MENQEPKKPRKPRAKKNKEEILKLPSFECPSCQHEIFFDIQIEQEHIYDHIMSCENCFARMTDHVFTRFVGLGVAMNGSFIRQAMKYVDEFMHIKMKEEGEID